jgi:hypothetical protein
MVMPYPFLSEEWVVEARKIRAEFGPIPTPVENPVRMNLVITEVPWADTLDAHIDTSSGEPDIEQGHIDNPDLTVTLDYETAKSLLVEGNAQAAMNAFMAGKVQVDGDMSKLLALQGTGPFGRADELAARIREITA